jgi:hypothetical protein
MPRTRVETKIRTKFSALLRQFLSPPPQLATSILRLFRASPISPLEMDPLSLSASIVGFISLAIEVTKILGVFIGDVKSAPQEATDLMTEVAALVNVLQTLVEDLREDHGETIFEEQAVLCTVISACQVQVSEIYAKLAKLRRTTKVMRTVARLTWSFQKDECLERLQTIHRYMSKLYRFSSFPPR